MMKTMLEVREYKFDDGTVLAIELDRRTKKMSFVEFDTRTERFMPSKFVFAGREFGYMNGWKNILSAMQYVIDDAKKEMERWDDEETDDFETLVVAVSDRGIS